MDLFDFTFYWWRFVVAALFTILPFLWLKRQKSALIKFYYIVILAFIFVYSGIGAAWRGTPVGYLPKYCIYMTVLGMVCRIVTKGKKKTSLTNDIRYSDTLDFVINRYGKFIVILYVSIPLIRLLVAGKIFNIFSPPSLSLTDAIDGRFDGVVQMGFIESVLYYIQELMLPFYLVCLYQYRNDIGKLSFFILAPFYFNYAFSGYLARSGTMPYILMLYIAFYLSHQKYRKKILVYTIIGIPAVLVFLSWYTFARQGSEFNISYGDAIYLLAQQETNFPMHYAELQHWPFDPKLFVSYINWILTLPLPGFLKSSSFDYSFTAIFSERILGMDRIQSGFNILLPGLIGESIFLFGKTFYWVQAIIVGVIIGFAFKLVHRKQELFLVLYMTFYSGICFARAGTVSMMPFYFKHLIIYILVIYFISHSTKRRIRYIGTNEK